LVAAEIDAKHWLCNPLFAPLWTHGTCCGKDRMMREPPKPPSPAKPGKPAPGPSREERLKAALKANMARRKAQAKARAADTTTAGKGE
jgi:hypothetical protein